MATIDQLKKHYSKLTAPERFALMVSASFRDDKAEESALEDSAPKINWEFPHTIGLTFGFRQLVKYHLTNQLGLAGNFWMLTFMSENEDTARKMDEIAKEEGMTDETTLTLMARRFLEDTEAFRAICKEYNIDPVAMEEKYNPCPMLSLMTELTVRRGFELSETELTDLEATKDQYRALIEESRKHWAEEKAR